jgi:hypothetical protein
MIVETLKWSDPAAAGESLKEGSGQAYGCLVYAAFGITAIVLVLAGQARWGSMPFWGLLVGTLAAVSLTIAASPLLDRLTRWLEDLDTLPSSMGYVLLVALLLVVPVASCLILVQVLNTVSSRF